MEFSSESSVSSLVTSALAWLVTVFKLLELIWFSVIVELGPVSVLLEFFVLGTEVWLLEWLGVKVVSPLELDV